MILPQDAGRVLPRSLPALRLPRAGRPGPGLRGNRDRVLPPGDGDPAAGGPPSRFLYVVRTGGVELLDDEVVIDLLEEGEMFGHPSLVAGLPPTFSVRAFEDTICYLIERQVAEEVIGTRSGIEFLARGLARRSRQMALASETERIARPPVPLSTILHRDAIGCAPTVSVRDAAATMAREAISSILVRADDLLGIVTDRDLRSKVVARREGSLDPRFRGDDHTRDHRARRRDGGRGAASDAGARYPPPPRDGRGWARRGCRFRYRPDGTRAERAVHVPPGHRSGGDRPTRSSLGCPSSQPS